MIQTILTYPHLNNCKGDLSKQWYVEYRYRVPGDPKPRRKRTYVKGTEAERMKRAYEIITEQTNFLKSGKLYEEDSIVQVDQTERIEVKRFNEQLATLISPINREGEFYRYKERTVSKKSMVSYKGRFSEFAKYCHEVGLSTKNITRHHVLQFLYTAEEKGLARLTIKKYAQIIRAYFDWEIDQGNVSDNPVKKIPNLGKVVDCAAVPLDKDERERMKEAMQHKNPWLWLACEIQFYCAVRPGTELRLLKIKDIDFERRIVNIKATIAKNNTSEPVSIPAFLSKNIQKMVSGYNKDFYLFGSKGVPGDTPLGKNTMRNRFNRYRDALGISADKKFYSWKHTGAISAIDAGMQPYQLQKHLRHKSFDTTEKYLQKRTPLHIDIDDFHTPI